MTSEQHIAFSSTQIISLAIIGDIQNNTELIVPLIIGGAYGCILADIDKEEALISQILFPIHKLIGWAFPHRDFTHSILAAILFSLIMYKINYLLGLTTLVVYLGHLFMDLFIKKEKYPRTDHEGHILDDNRSLPLLYPIPLKFRLFGFGNKANYIIIYGIGIINIFIAIQIYSSLL